MPTKENSQNTNVTDQLDVVLKNATRAIEERIPRDVMSIAEALATTLLGQQESLRRAFRREPGLIAGGLAAIAAGGIMLGFALSRGTAAVKSAASRVRPVSTGN